MLILIVIVILLIGIWYLLTNGQSKRVEHMVGATDCTNTCLDHCYGRSCSAKNPACTFCGAICEFNCSGGLQDLIKNIFVDEKPSDPVVAMESCKTRYGQTMLDICAQCSPVDNIVCRRTCLEICSCLQATEGGTLTDYYKQHCYQGTDPLPADCAGHGTFDPNANSCNCEPGWHQCFTGDPHISCCETINYPNCTDVCPPPPTPIGSVKCTSSPCPNHQYCQCIKNLQTPCNDDRLNTLAGLLDSRSIISSFCDYIDDTTAPLPSS